MLEKEDVMVAIEEMDGNSESGGQNTSTEGAGKRWRSTLAFRQFKYLGYNVIVHESGKKVGQQGCNFVPQNRLLSTQFLYEH